jgi:hypothetical protein
MFRISQTSHQAMQLQGYNVTCSSLVPQIMALKQAIYGVRTMQILNKIINEIEAHEAYYEGPVQIHPKKSQERQINSD